MAQKTFPYSYASYTYVDPLEGYSLLIYVKIVP